MDLVGARATHMKGTDFTIEQCSFGIECGELYPGESEDEWLQLGPYLRWFPRDVVWLFSYGNDRRAHETLGDLGAVVCERLDGLIDYGGTIPIGPTLPEAVPVAPSVIRNPHGLEGTLYAVQGEVDGWYATVHYSDASLLRSWRLHPGYYLVK